MWRKMKNAEFGGQSLVLFVIRSGDSRIKSLVVNISLWESQFGWNQKLWMYSVELALPAGLELELQLQRHHWDAV